MYDRQYAEPPKPIPTYPWDHTLNKKQKYNDFMWINYQIIFGYLSLFSNINLFKINRLIS